MIAYKCLKVLNGIVALVDLTGYDVLGISSDDISIHLTEYGLLIKILNIEIPIPESLFDFILENSNITIYPAGIENYIEEPVLSIEISKESLIEARGIYSFWKKAELKEKPVAIG